MNGTSGILLRETVARLPRICSGAGAVPIQIHADRAELHTDVICDSCRLNTDLTKHSCGRDVHAAEVEDLECSGRSGYRRRARTVTDGLPPDEEVLDGGSAPVARHPWRVARQAAAVAGLGQATDSS